MINIVSYKPVAAPSTAVTFLLVVTRIWILLWGLLGSRRIVAETIAELLYGYANGLISQGADTGTLGRDIVTFQAA